MDYVLVKREFKEKFIEALKKTVVQFYGKNPKESPSFARCINSQHAGNSRLMLNVDNHSTIILTQH